jgi:hypothetical protein
LIFSIQFLIVWNLIAWRIFFFSMKWNESGECILYYITCIFLWKIKCFICITVKSYCFVQFHKIALNENNFFIQQMLSLLCYSFFLCC